jgi:hypothetical protein
MARGARLQVERRIVGTTITYMHHGVDLGDGTVVHARPDDVRNPFGGGRVVRSSRAEFAGDGEVRPVTQPAAVFTLDEIARRAEAEVGRAGYCPVVDNCEHFATWCATGRRSSRQAEIVLSRVASAAARVTAAVSARMAGRVAVRTALGTTARLGLRGLVPAAVAAEAVALAAEWRAHQAGWSADRSRRLGESAGLATSAIACAAAGVAAGPAGMLAGGLAGAAIWKGGSLAAATVAGREPASG